MQYIELRSREVPSLLVRFMAPCKVALWVQQVQDKKIDTIVERYRINTNEVFQEQRHLRYYHRRYPLRSSDAEPMEVDVNTNLTFATEGFPLPTRFVLVNERMPRSDAQCASCGGTIEEGYVRDFRTRLIYCDTQCFAGGVYSVTKNRAIKRAVGSFLQPE